ncbi:hypothetical protein L915_15851 [Phytophthora nicotianae]|uniref:Uncharacterized protein n=1 Tax=Phytophthora nicotianae TaxID=4792 RepID=W2G4S2_PHYNI|nr:hypothetical protein L915_15851 [Phytophthora nicotianae]
MDGIDVPDRRSLDAKPQELELLLHGITKPVYPCLHPVTNLSPKLHVEEEHCIIVLIKLWLHTSKLIFIRHSDMCTSCEHMCSIRLLDTVRFTVAPMQFIYSKASRFRSRSNPRLQDKTMSRVWLLLTDHKPLLGLWFRVVYSNLLDHALRRECHELNQSRQVV